MAADILIGLIFVAHNDLDQMSKAAGLVASCPHRNANNESWAGKNGGRLLCGGR